MAGKLAPYILECRRQFENCLYTSTALFEYIKWQQNIQTFGSTVPLVLGSIAGWNVLASYSAEWVKVTTAICAFLAGLIPSILAALKFDENLDKCFTVANEYANLRDRYRQAAQITSHKGVAEIDSELSTLREVMEALRLKNIVVPEWAFKKAQAKIKKGDMTFDVDISEDGSGSNAPKVVN